jgi:hypothetical protein
MVVAEPRFELECLLSAKQELWPLHSGIQLIQLRWVTSMLQANEILSADILSQLLTVRHENGKKKSLVACFTVISRCFLPGQKKPWKRGLKALRYQILRVKFGHYKFDGRHSGNKNKIYFCVGNTWAASRLDIAGTFISCKLIGTAAKQWSISTCYSGLLVFTDTRFHEWELWRKRMNVFVYRGGSIGHCISVITLSSKAAWRIHRH